jgi:hypothetical protein
MIGGEAHRWEEPAEPEKSGVRAPVEAEVYAADRG